MNKSDLIRFARASAWSQGHEVTHAETEMIVNAFLRGIELCLVADEDVLVSGFGKFEVRHKNPVERRNPKNGDVIHVPAKRGVGFRASGNIKRALNE
jgi:nucleoid DNA-binding protein